MTTTTCGTCRFANPRPENGEGAMECRFNPPLDGRFTQTRTELWCGRWQAAETSLPAMIEAEGAAIAPARKDRGAPVAPVKPVSAKLPKGRAKK